MVPPAPFFVRKTVLADSLFTQVFSVRCLDQTGGVNREPGRLKDFTLPCSCLETKSLDRNIPKAGALTTEFDRQAFTGRRNTLFGFHLFHTFIGTVIHGIAVGYP